MAEQVAANQQDEEIQVKYQAVDLQCNVCFTIPENSPIYQCANGHLLCKTCRPKLERCPCCRKSLTDIRCLHAETTVRKIPTKCTFEGCVVILPREDLPSHSKTCQYRQVKCPCEEGGLLCLEMVQVGHLWKHIQTTHKLERKLVYLLEANNEMKGKVFVNDPVLSCDVVPLLDGYFYVGEDTSTNASAFLKLKFSELHQMLFIWIYVDFPEKECQKIVCELKILNEGTTKSISTTGPVVSLNVPQEQVLPYLGFVVKVVLHCRQDLNNKLVRYLESPFFSS